MPVITSFSPVIGTSGTSVVITGTDLAAATVYLNSTAITPSVNTATSITFAIPESTFLGYATISVKNADGLAVSNTKFQVIVNNPTITGFTPAYGPAGTTVTVTGTNLLDSDGTPANCVMFGNLFGNTDTPAQVVVPTVNTATSLQFVVPTHVKSGPVTVTTDFGGQVDSGSTPFVVTHGITSYAPTAAHVGNLITLTGSDLKEGVTATIEGVVAPIVSAQYGSLTLQVPVGAVTGPIVLSKTKNNVVYTVTATPNLTIS